jgi:hypothetical protein
LVDVISCGGSQSGANFKPDSGADHDGGGGSGGKGKPDGGGTDGGGSGGKGDSGISTSTQHCKDISCDVNATCSESGGKAKCTCNSGYSGNGTKCTDIDECAKANGGCDANATCVNRQGSFRCLCNETFSGDGKTCTGTDECTDARLNTCDPNATCKDTTTSFTCGACASGYKADNGACADVDECAGTPSCMANSTCRNTFGSYDCDCNAGYTGDGKTGCQTLCEVALAEGGSCNAHALCHVDTDPSSTSGIRFTVARCDACAPGYIGDGQTCTAIGTGDNCAQCDGAGSDEVAHAACTGTPGSGVCTCAPGYTGSVPNCAEPTDCTANGGLGDCGDHPDPSNAANTLHGDPTKDRCTMTPGGHVCDCQPGYALNEFHQCADIDECKSGEYPCHPDATCTNTDGSYTCKCNKGYSGDGSVCKDIDECTTGKDNCLKDGTARCVNTTGSFECVCLRGYMGDGVKSCKNIDECSNSKLNDCAANATCTDEDPKDDPIGYSCACGAGLGGDGTSCADVDECQSASLNNCAKNSTCVNKSPGFSCECQAPFAGSDPGSCYCDLSGYWAMRMDNDTTWSDIVVSGVKFIKAGEQKSTSWELHKYTYDGEKVLVEKQPCGNDLDPDFVSPPAAFGETYCSYIPQKTFFGLSMYKGKTIPEPVIVPGSMFTTPPEAALAGVDLGSDPENAQWPTDISKIHDVGGTAPAWTDIDGDGEPGLTGWSHVPSETPKDPTNAHYSYLPIDQTQNPNRMVCSSSGTRVLGRLDIDVESCTKMTGIAEGLRSEGYVRSCIRVDNAHKGNDYTCNPNDWTSLQTGTSRCSAAEIDDLNSQANPDEAPAAATTFELIKISDLSKPMTCQDVIKALPAIKR